MDSLSPGGWVSSGPQCWDNSPHGVKGMQPFQSVGLPDLACWWFQEMSHGLDWGLRLPSVPIGCAAWL